MARNKLTPLPSLGLNMAMMVGIGPFLTIPLMHAASPGIWVLAAWGIGFVLAVCDGMVWSELASAFPGSGGTFHFYDAVFGRRRIGRLLKFLFVWQFLFSGPLELASGARGMINHLGFFLGGHSELLLQIAIQTRGAAPWIIPLDTYGLAAAVVVCLVGILAYRGMKQAAGMVVALATIALVTIVIVVAAAMRGFHPAFVSWAAGSRLKPADWAAIVSLSMYCYLGYYQICYVGDEVENASRTIPRSIVGALVITGVAYLVLHAAIFFAMPEKSIAGSEHIAIDVVQESWGEHAAYVVTALIAATAFASVFAGLLGYSRIPYAAAKSGHFFEWLAKVHPKGEFPHHSVLLVTFISAGSCLAPLDDVIAALLTSRILIQFIGQIVTLIYVHRHKKLRGALRFRMWLYPLPIVIAFVGWLWLFGASKPWAIRFGALTSVVGAGVFWIWERRRSLSSAAGSHAGPPSE